MTFNIFMAQRVSCFGQYDRIDDLIPFNLRGDKCPVFRQFLVDEFYFSTVLQCFDPLFVWHFRIASGEIRLCREYTLVRCQKSRMGNETSAKTGHSVLGYGGAIIGMAPELHFRIFRCSLASISMRASAQ